MPIINPSILATKNPSFLQSRIRMDLSNIPFKLSNSSLKNNQEVVGKLKNRILLHRTVRDKCYSLHLSVLELDDRRSKVEDR